MMSLSATAPTDQSPRPREAEILEAVRHVFAEKGFDGASMQDLARAAEMSAGNFYRYFPSKDAIIECMVRRELAEIEAEYQRLIAADDPLATLRGMLHQHLDQFDRRDCAIWMEVLVSACRNPVIQRLYDDLMRSITDALLLAFAHVRQMPVEEARRRFGAYAEMIFMLIQGVNLNRIRRDGVLPEGVLEFSHRTLDLYLSEISQACASWPGPNAQDAKDA